MKLFFLLFCMLIGYCEAFGNFGSMVSSMNPMNMVFSNKCIEDLGCFSTASPFFSLTARPMSLSPDPNVKPKWMLFTQANPSKAYLLQRTAASLQNSPFDPTAKTMFFIHGFKFKLTPQDTAFRSKDELLKRGKYNIFIVDWSDYNKEPYPQAVANTRIVGAMIARLIKFLMDKTGISAQNVHLIGHSLGAHTAGYAGARLRTIANVKPGRITGLDPAGPFFQGTDPEVRLDTTDATFVDAIHTNGAAMMISGLGMTDAVAHMDFYPNGGSKQPGCANGTGDEAPPNDPTAVLGQHKCDHMRATKYFMHSINPNNRFQSVYCSSYADFKKGKCRGSSTVSPMGFHAQKKPRPRSAGNYYLDTSAIPPYSLR